MQLTVTTAPPCGKQPHHSVTGTHLGAIVFITLHPSDSFMLIGWITLDWLSSQWLVGCCSDKLYNITFCKLKDTSYLPKLAFLLVFWAQQEHPSVAIHTPMSYWCWVIRLLYFQYKPKVGGVCPLLPSRLWWLPREGVSSGCLEENLPLRMENSSTTIRTSGCYIWPHTHGRISSE